MEASRRRNIFMVATSTALFVIGACSTQSGYTPQVYYDIPCNLAESLPEIRNNGVWYCTRRVDMCSCIPVDARSIYSSF